MSQHTRFLFQLLILAAPAFAFGQADSSSPVTVKADSVTEAQERCAWRTRTRDVIRIDETTYECHQLRESEEFYQEETVPWPNCDTSSAASFEALQEKAKQDAEEQAKRNCWGRAGRVTEFYVKRSCGRSWDDLAQGRPARHDVHVWAIFRCVPQTESASE